jgi:hypothetical protein
LDDEREFRTRPESSVLRVLAEGPPRSLPVEDFLELVDGDRGLRFPTPSSFAPLMLCERLCATLGRGLRSGKEAVVFTGSSVVVLAEVAWFRAPVSVVATAAAAAATATAAVGCDLGRGWWEPALRTAAAGDDGELGGDDDKCCCCRRPEARGEEDEEDEEEASGRAAGVVGGAVDELAIATICSGLGLGVLLAKARGDRVQAPSD